MKLAFSTLACPQWSWDRVVEAAQAYGYEGLEIRLLDGEILAPDLASQTRQKVGKACRAAGLAILSVDTSLCVCQPDPAARELQIRDGLAFLELAAEWEAPAVRVFGYPPEGISQRQAEQAAIQCLIPLAERAQVLGVAMALETHDAFCNLASIIRIMQQVGGRGFGIIWDIMNTYSAGEPIHESARQLTPYLKHVHVKDGRRPDHPGEEWELCLLGKGNVPIQEAVEALHEGGYHGWLSVEWEKKWYPLLEEPEVALPQHAALLRKYLEVCNSLASG